MINTNELKGTKIVLVNPSLYPYDLRGETHMPDSMKSEKSINFGLLVIATVLVRHGAEVVIFDQEQYEREESFVKYKEFLNKHTPNAVGIGIVSIYTYINSTELLKISKELGLTTFVGGQSVIPFVESLSSENSNCDIVFMGDGEETVPYTLKNIFKYNKKEKIEGVVFKGDKIITKPIVVKDLSLSANLEYELYPNWKQFFPLIEYSRACPYRCFFCANSQNTNATYREKPNDLVIEEIERIIRLWGNETELPIILQCSNFGFDGEKSADFLKTVQNKNIRTRFLTALRVDTPWEKFVDYTEHIFDQVHFGLESASHQQLLSMNKTKNPIKYLSKAEKAFEVFHRKGVHVGINFIFGYFGETFQTATETMNFIFNNLENIDSAWGGAFVLYPGSESVELLHSAEKKYGSSLNILSPFNSQLKTYPVNASYSFSHNDAIKMSSLLMKIVNDYQKYYEHYRWYIGPDYKRGLKFYSMDDFYKNFFSFSDMENIGINFGPQYINQLDLFKK